MTNDIEIVTLNSIEEMSAAYFLISQLTPSLSKENYVRYLNEMVPHNYYQIAALQGGKMIGVSGYWIATKLYCGKYLEIDNLVVDEACRSRQTGNLLMHKLEAIALQQQCDVIMLDAYLHNTRAHQFYEKAGMQAKGYHFLKKLKAESSKHECLQ